MDKFKQTGCWNNELKVENDDEKNSLHEIVQRRHYHDIATCTILTHLVKFNCLHIKCTLHL